MNGRAYANDISFILDEQLMTHEKRKIKIALFCEGEGETFTGLLLGRLKEHGISPQISTFDLEHFVQETDLVMQGLESFQPDIVILLPALESLKQKFYAEEEFPSYSAIWQRLAQLKTRIIQCNYPLPLENFRGLSEEKDPSSFYSRVMDLNRSFTKESFILAHVDRLASDLGRRYWHDSRLWHISRTPASFEALEILAAYLSQLIQVALGNIIKLVILDLDQVLWAEIIDEVGSEGILKDKSSSLFIEFQHYLREIKSKGVMLALCSKNDMQDVLNVLHHNPRQVLKEADFQAMKIGWDEKDVLIQEILNDLHVSPEHALFIDDSNFEQKLVKASIPELNVFETSLDPLENIINLSRNHCFESGVVTDEDAKRISHRPLVNSSPDYLQSLRMKLTFDFATGHHSRIHQLHQRSNQFNMMVSRMGIEEIASLDGKTIVIHLEDLQSDLGLISVLHLKVENQVLYIRDWLLSCRAFSRDVEGRVLQWLMAYARRLNLQKIQGQFRTTEKNLLAQGFYPRHGFAQVRSHNDIQIWEKNVEDVVDKSFFLIVDKTEDE